MERDDLSLIIDVKQTPSPFGKELPNAMETLAIASYDPPCYKHVVVNMRGVNGNTLVIIGTVKQALKRAGASSLDLFMFVGDALSHDYEHALATVCKWVTVTDEPAVRHTDAWSAMIACATKNTDEPED